MSWLSRVACAGTPGWWWFPEGPTQREAGHALARDCCASCSVRRQCLAEALAQPAEADMGFRAGLTQTERGHMKRPARVKPAPWPTEHFRPTAPHPAPLDPADPRHGTQAGYGYYRCKCGACREQRRVDRQDQRGGTRPA